MPTTILAGLLHDGCNGEKIGQESGNGNRLPQGSEQIENVLDMMQPETRPKPRPTHGPKNPPGLSLVVQR